jgi:hypothetical protein
MASNCSSLARSSTKLTTRQLPGARTLPGMWTTLMNDSPLTSTPRIVPRWNR